MYTQFFTLDPNFIISGSSLAFPDKKKRASRPAFQSSMKNVKLLVMGSLKFSRDRVYTIFYAESEFHSLRV